MTGRGAIEKILSGRFILTIIAGAVFGWCACVPLDALAGRPILPPEATAAIIVAIVNSYFQRSDRPAMENPKSTTPTQQ